MVYLETDGCYPVNKEEKNSKIKQKIKTQQYTTYAVQIFKLSDQIE